MLDNLTISNGSMSPLFNKDIYNYDVYVDKDVVSLDIRYVAPSSSSITIYGNEFLTEGENHVLVEVYDQEVKTYTLTVYKDSTEVLYNTDAYQKVEVEAQSFINKNITSITVGTCTLLIICLFCIIFRKKKY